MIEAGTATEREARANDILASSSLIGRAEHTKVGEPATSHPLETRPRFIRIARSFARTSTVMGLAATVSRPADLQRSRIPRVTDENSASTRNHIERTGDSNSTAPPVKATYAGIVIRSAMTALRAFLNLDDEDRPDISDLIQELLERHGTSAVECLSRIVLIEGTDSELAVEALRATGRARHRASRQARATFAMEALQSSVSSVRYGAVLAIGAIRDREATRALHEARKHESVTALARDMDRLLRRLDKNPGESGGSLS